MILGRSKPVQILNKPVGGEDLGGGDPAEVALVVAVWCPSDTGVVGAENLVGE